MITKFTIQSRGNPEIWDIRTLVNNLKWATDFNFAAGTLTFDIMDGGNDFYPKNGDIVEFCWDEQKIFYGFIFKVSYSQDKKYSITAYDNLRYLKNQDATVWPVGTISDRFESICKMTEVPFKTVNTSDYKVPAEVCDSKSYFDMLKSAIDKTQKATDQMYYLATNYDRVELRKCPYNELELVIGDRELMTGFSFDESIDDAANVVRIVKKNQEESQSTSATATDSGTESTGDDPDKTSYTYTDLSGDTVSRWGKLQVVENAKENANEAQLKQQAEDLLKDKNRETYSLKLDALGNTSLIAGNSIRLKIKDLDHAGFKIDRAAILKATHNFGSDYTVELEMKVNPKWLENNSSE